MWREEIECKALLIDRAAAAEVPTEEAISEWAREVRVFVSSVIAGLGDERAAAADGIRAVGARPVMFEEFGGRDADPVNAYLGEVETSQIYLGILGGSYGTLLPTRYSATHTEFMHAESHGLRMAVWATNTQQREGPQQSFLEGARKFYVVPTFQTPADLRREVSERLRAIAAEDLSPWTKLGSIMFRASEVKHSGNGISVTARVQSDEVAHALESKASDYFSAADQVRFTWAGRCREVQVANVASTTTTARSKLMHLKLEVVESHPNDWLGVSFGGQTSADLTETALRGALFGEPNPLANQHMDFLAEIPDPIQPLRDAKVSDEIVRSLGEVMVVDELVGSGRATRITRFRLGPSVGGRRHIELEWEPSCQYTNERPKRRRITGRVRL